MPTASPKIPPLPAPDVPLVERDGTINADWYRWLSQFVAIVRQVRQEIP